MDPFAVYTIVNEKGTIYIGHTDSIEKRLKRHNSELRSKTTSFTKKQGGKWRLIYREGFSTRTEAVKRERQLKSAKGREFIRKLMEE